VQQKWAIMWNDTIINPNGRNTGNNQRINISKLAQSYTELTTTTISNKETLTFTKLQQGRDTLPKNTHKKRSNKQKPDDNRNSNGR
jgi:hypothetical protein